MAANAGAGRTPESSLAARVSPGASADLRLEVLHERLRSIAS
jgi:argininosuccinate lyase